MNIRENITGKNVTLSLDGNFDEHSSPYIESKLMTMIESPDIESISFNMDGVKYISSAGIRVLIVAHKRAIKNGKNISIGAMSPKVKEIIDVVGILPLFVS